MEGFLEKIRIISPESNISYLIIGSLISVLLCLLIEHGFPRLFKKIILSVKNKFFSNEQILGDFYGYYLNKDNHKSETVLMESIWKISADFKKNNYIITIYQDNGQKKKKESYKGKMWVQGDHYLLIFNCKEYEETIFERRIKVTKANKYPVVGISLAINPFGKIRSNVSVLSKKRLSLNDFYKIVNEYKVSLEKETLNLKVEK